MMWLQKLALRSINVREVMRDCDRPRHSSIHVEVLESTWGCLAVWAAILTDLIEPTPGLVNNSTFYTITDAGRRALKGQGHG